MKTWIFKGLRLLFWGARHKHLVTANVQRILVIKLCCIGDVLFTTPLLRALHANFPRAHIDYMVSPWCRELVRANSNVQRILDFDAYAPASGWGKLVRGWRARQDIRRGCYDVAIVLHRSGLATLLPFLAGVPIRIGWDWQGQGFSLTHPLKYRGEEHEVDRALDCLLPLGAGSEGDALEMAVPSDARQFAEAFLQARVAAGEHGPLVAIFAGGGVNPGTVMNTKRWKPSGYLEVCRELTRAYRARLLFVGTKSDAEVGDLILTESELQATAIRAEGKTDLLQLAALLEMCDLFIGGDSGPLHLAAAVETPTVSIYGPTDPKRLAPRGAWHRVVRHEVSCAPCYTPDTVHQEDVTVCRRGSPVCMLEVTPEAVLDAAEELLHKKGFLKS
ncbi:MAG: lipopolysaccharide heptosyltransferase II [Candidatus Firestonebacteria bacterium]|nr:lipopolysaccharide heptosyltransferase II [Candidatus Firestonebacteria bacterium]